MGKMMQKNYTQESLMINDQPKLTLYTGYQGVQPAVFFLLDHDVLCHFKVDVDFVQMCFPVVDVGILKHNENE